MVERSFPLGLVGLDFQDVSLRAFFRFAAEHGLDHIDLYARINLAASDAEEAASIAKEHGVKINSVSSRAMPNTPTSDPQEEVALALEALEVAARVGARLSESMVGPSTPELSSESAIDQYLDRAAPILKRAHQLGVVVLVENVHNRDGGMDVTATVENTLSLVDDADGQIALCWDSGNFIVDGTSELSTSETLDLMLPHTELIQLKDVAPVLPHTSDTQEPLEDDRLMREPIRGTWRAMPSGEGTADLSSVVSELRARGWTKPVSVDLFCSPPHRDVYWLRTQNWLRQNDLVD